MAAVARKVLRRDDLHAIADKGYFSGSQILACHQAGITTTVPHPETSGNRGKGMYVKADFAYDPARDAYLCPAGEELAYRYTREEDGLRVGRYGQRRCPRTSAHRPCQLFCRGR